MSLKAGIVGLPNVGKSTLFNAITKQKILAANYPFATIDPNVGIVTVPDRRMDFLVEVCEPDSIVPTTFEFTDIAGLVKGASNGEGLGNKFLTNIRETDAIVEVVRCFSDDNVTHVEGKVDPIRDIEIIGVELLLSDLEIINNRLTRIGKRANEKEYAKEVELMNTLKDSVEKNIAIRALELNEEELKIIKPFNFLTAKPIIYVANVNEDEIETENDYVKEVREYATKEDASVVVLCAKIEAEIAELEEEEKEMFLAELGINQGGLDQLINATYKLLGLATYFTIGKQEVRAWTFKKGMKAPACAGIIHTDFEKGFIKAEVFSYDDLFNLGNEKAVKEAGKLRLEGKEYIMKDGDICHFRFN